MVDLTLTLVLPDEPATLALGTALADALRSMSEELQTRGMVIGVAGELGSGKTTLTRAVLRRLGVVGAVKSPTFALLEPYEVSRLHLYHFDFYRFKNSHEFVESGFSDFFGPGNICLVEWPERAGKYLPPADLDVQLAVVDMGRSAAIGANTEIGERCLHQMRTSLAPAGAGA